MKPTDSVHEQSEKPRLNAQLTKLQYFSTVDINDTLAIVQDSYPSKITKSQFQCGQPDRASVGFTPPNSNPCHQQTPQH
jgi:hypothetical protein